MITINDKKDCCGCTACANICPKSCILMEADNEGFKYPTVNRDLCIDCGLCEKICPVINYRQPKNEHKIYGLRNKDEDIVKSSTSGGVFLALAGNIIAKGGTVVGAAYDKDFNVVHQAATTLDECRKFQGAKYVESTIPEFMLRDIKRLLVENKDVLFVGTPCQVAGLKAFLRKPFDNLLTCDLVCSSVPSSRIYRDFLSFAQRKKKISAFNMRWKGNGWDKTKPQIVYADGSKATGKGDARLWHTIAFSHLVSRPSCHDCKFSNFNRSGDITIGDFWGVESSHPEFFSKEGVSLAIVSTPKGEKIFDEIKSSFHTIESSEAKSRQPRLTSPVKPNPRRAQFWEEYSADNFQYFAKKYWRYGAWNQLKLKVRLNAGRIYHTLIRK